MSNPLELLQLLQLINRGTVINAIGTEGQKDPSERGIAEILGGTSQSGGSLGLSPMMHDPEVGGGYRGPGDKPPDYTPVYTAIPPPGSQQNPSVPPPGGAGGGGSGGGSGGGDNTPIGGAPPPGGSGGPSATPTSWGNLSDWINLIGIGSQFGSSLRGSAPLPAQPDRSKAPPYTPTALQAMSLMQQRRYF
jgi:hypothetical protein